MRVYYIGHSGFLVEMKNVYLLFDYYEGELPKMNEEKPLFIFVSHKHQDHYNREIWKFKKCFKDVWFILSKEVPFSARQRELLGISEEDCNKILRVHANQQYILTDKKGNEIRLETLKSTDLGVAFFILCEGCYLYHAGDLNRWVWKEEAKEKNQDMIKKYRQQLERLRQLLGENRILAAFLPLDPRQEEEAFGGICEFLEMISVDRVFPMHLWGKYDWIEQGIQFVSRALSEEKANRIIRVSRMGQEWGFE